MATDTTDALSSFRALCASLTAPGSQPMGELSALVALLRAEAEIAQSHHWQSRGPNFLSDHQLYQQIYETVFEQVDGLAERAVGLGSIALVQPVFQAETTHMLVSALYGGNRGTLDPEEMAKVTLGAVNTVLDAIALCIKGLSTRNKLTLGLENLLQTYADEQEKLGYFLRQRTSR